MSGVAFRRVKLTVRYNGALFAGSQQQPNVTTVCGCLQQCLGRLLGHKPVVTAASRTDRGVHALGQVLQVEVPATFGLKQLRRALNQQLPQLAIGVRSVASVSPRFHGRFDALSRVYEYRLTVLAATELPLSLQPWVWAVPRTETWSEKRLRAAVSLYAGTHDFSQFTVRQSAKTHGVRTVLAARVSRVRVRDPLNERTEPVNLYCIRIEGTGFLRQMVRLLVAAAVEHAKGNLSLAQLSAAIAGKQAIPRRVAAPPHGLVLRKVRY